MDTTLRQLAKEDNFISSLVVKFADEKAEKAKVNSGGAALIIYFP